jgi:hypothetical protein
MQRYTVPPDPNRTYEVGTHWDEYTLTPGVLDYDAMGAFTTGQCHALALEVHRITGWELWGLWEYYNLQDHEEGGLETPGHVIVKTFEGEYVDVQGIGAEKRWSKQILHAVTEGEIMQYEEYDYNPPMLNIAALFAPAVVALVEEQRKTNQFPKSRDL